MFEQAFRNIGDGLGEEAGCTTELDYTAQTSRLLFLKCLDWLEQDLADEAALAGRSYGYILDPRYRWEQWAAPKVVDRVVGVSVGDRSLKGGAVLEEAAARVDG